MSGQTAQRSNDNPPKGLPHGVGLPRAGDLQDSHGRKIDHLRLSVTSACDLRCVYCRPRGAERDVTGRALSDRQRTELVAFLYERFGLRQVRITGGEPLLYPGVVELVRLLRRACPQIGIAMTTNGRLLAGKAAALRAAGLDRLNVSLDSIDAATHRRMTGGEVDAVLRGLSAAERAGFPPPKLNTVVLRGYNDTEVPDIAAWALARGCEVRFLEAMPIGPAAGLNRRHFVPAREIRDTLAARFELSPLPHARGETARRYAAFGTGKTGLPGVRRATLCYANTASRCSAPTPRPAHETGLPGVRRATLCYANTASRCSAPTPRPAHETGLQGVRGVIGMIAPVTEPFCGDCRRMRVSADGRLFPCLLDGRWVDLSEAWANPLEADLDTAVAERLVHAGVWEKPFRGRQQTTAMVTLGG